MNLKAEIREGANSGRFYLTEAIGLVCDLTSFESYNVDDIIRFEGSLNNCNNLKVFLKKVPSDEIKHYSTLVDCQGLFYHEENMLPVEFALVSSAVFNLKGVFYPFIYDLYNRVIILNDRLKIEPVKFKKFTFYRIDYIGYESRGEEYSVEIISQCE